VGRRAVLGTAVLVLALAGCASGPSPVQETRPLKIALLLASTGRGDMGFNDTVIAGLDTAKSLGPMTVVERLLVRADEYAPVIDQLAADAPDLIIGVGFLYADPFRAASARHPGRRFLLLDVDAGKLANVKSVTFRADEGSFLAGVAAAAESSRGAIGFVGGMRMPIVEAFQCGYEAGARWAARELGRKIETHGIFVGTTPEAFAHPARAAELTRAMIDVHRVDVVYHAAAASGLAVINVAQQLKVKAIGVDADQSHLAPGVVITSMRKRLDRVVETTVAEVRRGTFRGGPTVMNLANGGVELVTPGHLAPPTQQLVAKARAAIIAGQIPACP
jgi:basic membrane protein A and related proteins